MDLPLIYDRQCSNYSWCAYEPFFTAILFCLCNHWNSFRCTTWNRKSSGANDPYMRRGMFLRILWLFTAGQMYPGINTIMLSYPVSWSITAVLFIVYYFMKFPGKKEKVE